jgi:hypothetical protein
MVESLSANDLLQLKSNFTFHLPIINVFAIEMACCMHSKVCIDFIAVKFLTLALRLTSRLEFLVGNLIQQATPSFSQELLQTLAVDMVEGRETDSSRAGLMRICVRDCILLVDDLGSLAVWLSTDFLSQSQYTLAKRGCDAAYVDKCLALQTAKLAAVRSLAWTETCRMLSVDCKENLLGVKGVASKYRMTSKPPPTTPSPYVETILMPIRYAFQWFIISCGTSV